MIRLDEFGSSILRSNDRASVSILLHGVNVIHELSLFHLTNSVHPVVGSSHGNSVDDINLILLCYDFLNTFNFISALSNNNNTKVTNTNMSLKLVFHSLYI